MTAFRYKWALLLLAMLTVLFAAILGHLVQIRFASGDVYPPYSTLRSDPLGLKVLYLSLKKLPQTAVARNHKSANERGLRDQTVVFAGVTSVEALFATPDTLDAIWDLAATGNRVVIAFHPQAHLNTLFMGTTAPPPVPPAAPGGNAAPVPAPATPTDELLADWPMLAVKVRRQSGDSETAHRSADMAELPAELWWPSQNYFEPSRQRWTTVYSKSDKPVLIERAVGKGSLVLASDSYWLSNEAMANAPASTVIVWAMGDGGSLVFDEFHHGVKSTAGIAQLARRYRLHGLGLALLVLVILYLWRATSSLLPRVSEAQLAEQARIAGQSTSAGLTRLLKRHIPPQTVLQECVQAWQQSLPVGRELSQEKKELLQGLSDLSQSKYDVNDEVVNRYREICRAIRRKV